jgi:hypothetical protein
MLISFKRSTTCLLLLLFVIMLLLIITPSGFAYAVVQRQPTQLPGITATSTPLPTEQPSLNVDSNLIDLSLNAKRNELVQLVKNSHNLYLWQMPEKYRAQSSSYFCSTPPEHLLAYYEGLQKVISRLLTHELAKSFTLAELNNIFWEVVHLQAKFIAGEQGAVLVALKGNRGCSYGSHYPAEESFYVVDQSGMIWKLEQFGYLVDSWNIDGRWILTINQKANPGSEIPGPFLLLQIGKVDGKWQAVVSHYFTPYPDFVTDMHFENGYQTMIANIGYWYGTDPCKFTRAFQAKYKHDIWLTRQTFQLVNGDYQLTNLKILDFTLYERDSGQVGTVDWRDFCLQR